MSDAQKTVHLVFSGPIDQAAVHRIFNNISIATQNGITDIHLLFHSAGGMIQDGICLYNFFRTAPVNLTLYNSGSVQSIATIAYLAATHRVVSNYASFMIHSARTTREWATADALEATAKLLRMDNSSIEAILENHISLPPEKAAIHAASDLWVTAQEAVDYGFADRIGDFHPPKWQTLYNI